MRSAFKATDEFGRFAALGITVMVLSQALINLGVVLGMMPTKGIPLPFISYGGSSLLVIARGDRRAPEYQPAGGIGRNASGERHVAEAGKGNLTLLIAGGGTGGHVFPALAVALEWLSRGEERKVVFVGNPTRNRSSSGARAGFPLETIRSAASRGSVG